MARRSDYSTETTNYCGELQKYAVGMSVWSHTREAVGKNPPKWKSCEALRAAWHFEQAEAKEWLRKMGIEERKHLRRACYLLIGLSIQVDRDLRKDKSTDDPIRE